MRNLIKNILTVLVPFLLITSCQNEKANDPNNEWANSSWQYLKNENIRIRIPHQLKPTSRYRLKDDLPFLARDTAQLRLIQNSLHLLEFEDSELDVFVDTTKAFRLVVICNIQRVEFNQNDAAIISKQLELSNQESADLNPNLEFGKIEATLQSTQHISMARYTTPIRNKLEDTQIFCSIYYLTARSFTLIVNEYSGDEELFEKYLWSARID